MAKAESTNACTFMFVHSTGISVQLQLQDFEIL